MKANDSKTDLIDFNVDFTLYKTQLTKKFINRKPYKPVNLKQIYSFIPGTIKKIYVNEGDTVKAGDKLLVLEAMKMKNDIITEINGTVNKINVKINEKVNNKQILIELK
ncbi:MAG: biotin/lipoyl-binding protein [Bacteroidales bacterium]|nr:biotin/lipoyl-binding protein [Bacteroidales bacterium]